MRFPGIVMLGFGVPLIAACNGPACGDGDEGDEAVHTLELGAYSSAEPPSPLSLSNETLVFPLATDQETWELTASSPGDLVAAYTRVGCWIDDPETWIGQVPLREVPPVHLTEVTIEQVSDGVHTHSDATSLSGGACLTYRSCDGAWHSLLAPAAITGDAVTSTATFAVDLAGADAVGIFLPLYTNVSRITYTAE